MNEKKNIDKLFKEQFKNFDVAPKEHVWENIEEQLHEDKRKKRRVIPIWWRYAGIAAGLVLLFTVANQIFNASDNDEILKDSIVDESKINNRPNSQNDSSVLEQNDSSKELIETNASEEIVDTNSNTSAKEDTASINKNKSNTITSGSKENPTIASENSGRKKRKENLKNSSISNTKDYKKHQEEKRNSIDKSLTKDAMANSNKASSKTDQSLENTIKDKSELDALINSNKSTEKNTTIVDINSKEKGVSETKNPKIEITTTEDTKDKEEEESNAIENAIAEAENTDEKEQEEEKLNRWSVSPSVAPVYFSSLGKEGSPLDNQFIKNAKESDINMSYGINGSYAVNKKLKIRAGINKVQLGYQTNDVLIFENENNSFARNSSQMDNVEMGVAVGRYSIYSVNSFKFDNAPATLFTQEKGSLDQQLGFIEVPIELEYNVIENKIGLNLIGGFSALFLNENDIYAVLNNGDRARLGEASNIKDLSYTANFGIGLDYNFSKQFQFNLDPTFKYQINTFNNTSGDFKPFFIGVYTGLSFKF